MNILIFIYGWILYNVSFMATTVVSDAFVTNLPMIITAVCSGLAAIIGAVGLFIATIAKNNAATAAQESIKATKIVEESKVVLEQLHTTTNSKMDALLQAKDDLAKGVEDSAKIKAIEEAAYNRGKLEVIGKQPEKEEGKIIEQVVEKQVVEKQDVLQKGTPPKK